MMMIRASSSRLRYSSLSCCCWRDYAAGGARRRYYYGLPLMAASSSARTVAHPIRSRRRSELLFLFVLLSGMPPLLLLAATTAGTRQAPPPPLPPCGQPRHQLLSSGSSKNPRSRGRCSRSTDLLSRNNPAPADNSLVDAREEPVLDLGAVAVPVLAVLGSARLLVTPERRDDTGVHSSSVMLY